MSNHEQIIIAGPCAAESRCQILECAQGLKERGIFIERACWWKPRTRPGFEGVGRVAAPWAAEVTNMGITMGTEVLIPEDVTTVIEGINENKGNPSKVLLWLGSRNQNHLIQREIARRVLNEAPNNVRLLIKNQPWSDEAHWLGIVDHVVSVGIGLDRLILCHRGFSPNGYANPNNFRNLPDFDMAMRVKEVTGLPMLFDPSHIGGNVENVFKVSDMAAGFPFDGLMVEVHPSPSDAQTDAKQQLTFQELDRLLNISSK
jgi:chorismate mutase